MAAREIERVRRTGRDLSLLAIDIDHFKRINDAYGHAEGDEVLKQMVMTVESKMRSVDYFEEFAILMPDTDLEGARVVAERLRVLLAPEESPAQLPGSPPAARPYTVSIGVAQLRTADTFHELMQRADAALYKAKDRGRNCVVCAPGLA